MYYTITGSGGTSGWVADNWGVSNHSPTLSSSDYTSATTKSSSSSVTAITDFYETHSVTSTSVTFYFYIGPTTNGNTNNLRIRFNMYDSSAGTGSCVAYCTKTTATSTGNYSITVSGLSPNTSYGFSVNWYLTTSTANSNYNYKEASNAGQTVGSKCYRWPSATTSNFSYVTTSAAPSVTSYTVTCLDYDYPVTKNLGTAGTRTYTSGSTAYGSDWGTSSPYAGYVYYMSSDTTVTSDCNVYRYFTKIAGTDFSNTLNMNGCGSVTSCDNSSSYPWQGSTSSGGTIYSPQNLNVASATSSITYTVNLTKEATFSCDYTISSEANYDKGYIYIDGVALVNAVSGSSLNSLVSSQLSTGTHTIELRYTKDGSVDSGTDNFTVSNMKFTAAVTNYTITYNANGGNSTPSTQTVASGSSTTAAADITRNSSTGSQTSSDSTLTTTLVYKDGLTANGSLTTTKTTKTTPTTSYTFAGWEVVSGTGTASPNIGSYSAGTIIPSYYLIYPASNTTLRASWTTSTTNSYDYTYTTTTLPTPTKSGFTCLGWGTSDNGTVTNNCGTSYQPTGNTTLYGNWRLDGYVKVNNEWKNISVGYVKENGVWKEIVVINNKNSSTWK